MSQPGLWRSQPIFITSTFRDMQAERDWLRTQVLPELEERLRVRRCHLEPIDLRWGVETASEAEEQSRDMRVLKVCLAEVERSRPFLIGLLGDRYGWVPPVERMEAAAQEAGFKGEVAGRSVTDLEIDYGVLSSPEQRRRSFFYFREPLPYGEMPDGIAAQYSEEHNPEAGAAEAAKKLAGLKQRIAAQLPDRVRPYQARWDKSSQSVVGLEAWGKQVLEDIWRELDAETAEFARSGEVTWQEAERSTLDEFVEGRARNFIGREETLRELLDLTRSPAGEGKQWGACVTGVAGAGKSALFAKLYQELRGGEALVLAHAAGVSPRSTQVDAMLRRWTEELAMALGMADPLDEKAPTEDVEKTFHELLGRASVQRRVIILVDALNQFEPTVRAKHVTWLPKYWPENARLIATAIPGSESEALEKHPGVKAVEVPALSAAEAVAIAKAVCGRYHRELNQRVLEALLAKRRAGGEPSVGNPLWLELAVEELNLLDAADFARADSAEFSGGAGERLLQLLLAVVGEMPPDVEELYGWMLDRAEKSFGKPWAQAFVNLIAVSRAGWRESDLRELIPKLSGQKWDPLTFASLRRTFRAHVVCKGAQAQWDFTHAQMRLAVMTQNLGDEGAAHTIHQAIAAHLLALPKGDPLHESETMVHLVRGDDRLMAARYYASDLTPGELAGATRVLADLGLGDEESARHGIAWLGSLLDLPGLADAERGRVCNLFVFDLHDTITNEARLNDCLQLVQDAGRVLAHLTDRGPPQAQWLRGLSVANGKRGDILRKQGRLAEALNAYNAGRDISEAMVRVVPENPEWQRDRSVSCERVGDVLQGQGHLPEALEAFRRSFDIRQELIRVDPDNAEADGDNTGWQYALGVCNERVGTLLAIRGDLIGAMGHYSAKLAIMDRLARMDRGNALWQRDLSLSHNKMGDVLVAQGKLPEALEAFEKGLATREELVRVAPDNALWLRDRLISFFKIAEVRVKSGDAARAGKEVARALAEARRLVQRFPEVPQLSADLKMIEQLQPPADSGRA